MNGLGGFRAVHDYSDPELSILKQRLARRLQHEGCTEAAAKGLSLVDLTGVAERTITDDLEFLIKNAVDPSKADYAVVTGAPPPPTSPAPFFVPTRSCSCKLLDIARSSNQPLRSTFKQLSLPCRLADHPAHIVDICWRISSRDSQQSKGALLRVSEGLILHHLTGN